MNSLPRLDVGKERRLTDIPGLPPLLLEKPIACPFKPRCPYGFEKCEENPPLVEIAVNHKVACWWDVKEGKPRNV
jgi:oligopeptide/dipeptide ABC transporter ATP-binding protein